MFGAKRNRIVGLDIGSKTIKAAEIVESKKGFTLSKFGMSDIAPGLIEDGAVKDPEAVADTLKTLFKTYGIRNGNVALSIGGYSVIVKKISVPT
ncbi:MAG: pilus assembly protein PilM, partial [Desulfobacteraceae bacterium]